MLISNELIQNAIKHFPRWMDIRKRHKTSVGGKLLNSVSNKTAEIQEEIDLYIKQHFMPFYEDKCEIIPDFIYRANIGKVDISSVILVDPDMEIIEDIKVFYESNNKAYYQDGFIFVKENTGQIFYTLDGYKTEAALEEMHVWNVYDEFATFVGLKRYENESNKELYNRIINVSKTVLNSSEQGIKNAITSNLINIIPELNIEDIILERPTPENLRKYYDEFETVLDKLANVNKDVLRTKKWDIDKWSNSFKQIDYIPHAWDVILDDLTNGVGDNDDLKPIFIDADTKTDLNIAFYSKSDEYVDSYIKDKNIDHKLNLSLVKYNNILNPYTAKYTITASEAEEIITTDKDNAIMVELYETLKGEHYRKIEDLIDNISQSLTGIEIIKAGLLKENKYYRVKFTPKSKYDSMEIYDCLITDEYNQAILDEYGNPLSYKDPKGDFMLIDDKLVNGLVKKSVSKLVNFDIHKNAIDTGTGVTIDKIDNPAELILKADNCSGEPLKIIYDCELSNVLERDIELNNFFFDKDKNAYVPDNVGDVKNVIVNVDANQFSVTASQGQCIIAAFIDGEMVDLDVKSSNGQYIYSTKRFTSPKNMRIEISSMFNNYVEISDIKYSNYDISVTTEKADPVLDSGEEDLYWMPQGEKNNVIINLRTRTQFSPVVRRVFIGRPLDENSSYETDLIKGEEARYLNINSNCNVELYESNEPFASCDPYDKKLTVTKGYTTDKIYKAISDNAQIVLNTSEYVSIENIKISDGSYELIGYGQAQRHVINLKIGQSISGITINGHYNSLIASRSIHELIKNENIAYEPYVREEDGLWEFGHKLYANKLLNCFVIEDNNFNQTMVSISTESFKLNGDYNISHAVVYNLSESLQAAFSSIDSKEGHTIISNTYDGAFSNLCIYPKYAKEYVARNEYTTYLNNRSGIEMVNTFNNGYVDGSLMVYKIAPTNIDEFNVTFDNNKSWSIGREKITINLLRDKDYNLSRKIISDDIKLSSTVPLKDVYTSEDKELVEIAQYIIDTKDAEYEVVYKQDISNIDYDRAEFIDVKNDGFNKLKYSNIVGIKYLGTEVYNDELDGYGEISESAYELDKEKGIIVWKDKEIINNTPRLYILYSIKKAIAIKFKTDYLYKKIQYPIKAYKKLSSYNLEEVENGKKIDLNKPMIGDIELSNKISSDYRKSDAVYVTCKNPGYACEKIGDVLLIKKAAETNSLAIKSGWYYMLGREYYMFASDQSKNLVEDEYITYQEVNKIDNELYLHKKTANYIRNSKMVLGSLANSYNIFDFGDIKSLKGISNINSITACDSYNHWVTFAMDISFTKGLNGLGLYFNPNKKYDIGYALLDITKYITAETTISFYNPGKLSVYIGKEKLINGISLTDTVSISSMAEITDKNSDNICYSYFKKEEGYKYYIVVRGQGILDDIIIQDGKNPDTDAHIKNISNLNLEVAESTTGGVVSRVLLNQDKGNKNNGAEISSLGYIVNASNIDWNVTKIKSYSSEREWLTGWSLDNVNVNKINDKDCAIITEGIPGQIITKPIYVGDPNTINSIIFKINNIPIKSMTGISAQIMQAQTSNGSYVPCKQKLNNSSLINYTKDLLYPYIKLLVDIPKSKVIDNIEIFIEYKSTEQYAPSERIESNGEFITKVFDSRHSANYRLKSVMVEDQSGVANLSIRASKEGAGLSVWTDWYQINMANGNVVGNIDFNGYRFFQMKVSLSGKDSKIKIKHFELEVKSDDII